jgi:putative ABC transport system permease protein
MAYPVARRFRTGAILVMYGLVFTLVLITVLGSVIGSTVDRAVADASGGYAIRVDYSPSAPVADPAGRFTEGRFAGRVQSVVPLSAGEARVAGLPGLAKPVDTTVVGATAALAEHGGFRLDARLDRLDDDRAVWRAVMADPRYVLLDQYLGDTGAGPTAITYRPGDTMTITDPSTGRTRQKTIAGILADDSAFDGIGEHSFGSPVIMAADGLREQFGTGAKATSALLRTAPGVVMVRAVRERRRTVGVLRALGFPARVVRRAFLIESSFVALEGILLGTGLSIVTSYLLFRNDDELQAAGSAFPIPWLAISILVAATAAASLAATAWPARQAARIRPAVALRIAD